MKNYNNRLYRTWHNMRMRCNPNVKSNPLYKIKGITVCDDWNDFENFKSWALNNGYDEKLTIDRINNDEGYSPNNCRWVDKHTQSNNRSSVIRTAIRGVERTLTQHAEYYGIPNETVRKRYHRGIRDVGLVKAAYKK